jgi:hypothetical protein
MGGKGWSLRAVGRQRLEPALTLPNPPTSSLRVRKLLAQIPKFGLVLVLVVVLRPRCGSAFSPAKRARLSRNYFVQLF